MAAQPDTLTQSLVSQPEEFEQKFDEQDVQNATIFVSVVNYRDCEGQYTLKDLFGKAANPSRVHVGYCLQYNPLHDSPDINHHFNELYQSALGKNIRTLFMSHTAARGPMYARYLVQKRLFRNEKYYLQIDCHMRFIKNWDEILIKQYHACNDKQAVITTYPSAYDTAYLSALKRFHSIKDWDGCEMVDVSLLDSRSNLLCADRFGNDGFLRIKAKQFHKYPRKPVLSLFYAAGFNFSLSTVIADCPMDPNLKCLFFGEESVNALKLYTNGYNFYAPTRAICYHLWNRKDSLRKGVWRELYEDEVRKQQLVDLENASKQKVQEMLTGEWCEKHSEYAVGSKRSLQEYQMFCGVNFKTKKISDDARYGGITENERETMFEEFQQNKLMDLISSFQST